LASIAAQQANVTDATDSAFFEVDFGTLRLSVIEGIVGAANLRGVRRLVWWLVCFCKEVVVVGRDAVGQKSEDRPSQQGESTFWPEI
jgi:hypothetical protein